MPPTIRVSSTRIIVRACCLLLFLCAIEAFLAPHAEAAITLSKTPNNLGLVGYWSFDDGTGTVATDFSGNGNTGTLVDGGGGAPIWTNGKRGKAVGLLSLAPFRTLAEEVRRLPDLRWLIYTQLKVVKSPFTSYDDWRRKCPGNLVEWETF